MNILNNCDELIEFVCNELTDYPLDTVMFQGDILKVCRTTKQYPICTVDKIFVSDREIDNCFFLQYMNGSLPMMTPTIMVPNYVKEELIATLKGELVMKHTEDDISIVMSYGYTREEAINILDGKNPDGSKFIELPF